MGRIRSGVEVGITTTVTLGAAEEGGGCGTVFTG
jgi:hypothetical protein